MSAPATVPLTSGATTLSGAPRVSAMADALIGSEILKIAAEIRAMREAGQSVCNLTVGDFDPAQFPIPESLEAGIAAALHGRETNYPPSSGVAPLRAAVRELFARDLALEYPVDGVLVTGGSRPGIYGVYRTLVDPGDAVVYPVPSWNNNHYVHLASARGVPVVCGPDTAFLPTADLLADAVRGARLLALNSPLNPAGTAFTEEQLAGICDLVLEENARRGPHERPLYVMYDQVYWMLTFGATRHVTPVALRPEMRAYTVFVDGISKAFAATGVRVGWVVGPDDVMGPMSNLLGHIGAWAPRAEQVATTELLRAPAAIAAYRRTFLTGVQARLDRLHDACASMHAEGLPVEAIAPMGAIYLSARFALNGRRAADGTVLDTNEAIRRWLLRSAGLAVVPFQAFGSREETGWFRLSVGACTLEEIDAVMPRLRAALAGTA